jgi:hypothetical protein
LASLSGAPEPLAEQIKSAFAQQAAERDITIADSKDADYLVRGYVNAAPTESGTAVTVVLDIFDAAKKRALRLHDSLVVNIAAAASDPWSAIDVASISNMAAKTTENLAAFLTTTPEALAGAKAAPAPKAMSTAQAGAGKGRTSGAKARPEASASISTPEDLSIAALGDNAAAKDSARN